MDIETHLEFWKKKEPWFYSDLIFNGYTYALISGVILSLVACCLFLCPILTNALGLILGYFLAQNIFQWGHMTTHALYIESPIEEWEPGVLVAYLHHYENPNFIYKYSLNHRLNFLMQTRGSFVAYLAAWVLPFIIFGGSLFPLYCWFLFWFSMIEPVHEWYHVPKWDRPRHFSVPVYFTLSFLSWIGLLNESRHRDHHAHNKNNLKAVTKFSDLYVPFSDWVFDRLWRNSLRGESIRRGIYLQGVVLIPLTFTFCAYLFQVGR